MKPRVGVFGLSGCWGEQIVILNCEDDLLKIAGEVTFVDFLGASSANDRESPLDLAFVEGSVAGPAQEAALRLIRARTTTLIACGSCACFGGISAMDAVLTRSDMAYLVYGPAARKYETAPHSPLGDFVKVDVAIPGCPMEKEEFLRAVALLLNGDVPEKTASPVCADCKAREQDCLLISRGIPCAGPVTASGCGARCPGYNVPCIGCRGPAADANFSSMQRILAQAGIDEETIRRRLRTFASPVVSRETVNAQ
jgi:coenzyme F420-reducing hydrogenase gamma subunit